MRAKQSELRAFSQPATKRLRLKVNCEKSAVDRPWRGKFLGFSVTINLKPSLRVSAQAVMRFKQEIGPLLRAGRGRRLSTVIAALRPVLTDWAAYFGTANVKVDFEKLGMWIRRKLRCIIWRQWKTPRTRFRKLRAHGVYASRAARTAWSGRVPWWNAGASHMNLVLPTKTLGQLGLMSLSDARLRFAART